MHHADHSRGTQNPQGACLFVYLSGRDCLPVPGDYTMAWASHRGWRQYAFVLPLHWIGRPAMDCGCVPHGSRALRRLRPCGKKDHHEEVPNLCLVRRPLEVVVDNAHCMESQSRHKNVCCQFGNRLCCQFGNRNDLLAAELPAIPAIVQPRFDVRASATTWYLSSGWTRSAVRLLLIFASLGLQLTFIN